ncbi:UDP-N-acetylmuramoylalanine--D-glutamate ligase [Candidatus Pelagibacter ubique]|uniref:UDP-N-acetylmuramoylalanine--D-glutamate ligase n=1 Tax=Pelagibacter ubique TaxID=198252 RepID=A0ABX1T3E6_PELUQ|nr:UDP-N-acetylmuramoyl-L-alanine--D-glutamate ligase [Candidatus Pelagibacter ubique]NMN67589.1 UDP-N-acetylmuramoylalanine--D-glutamate ligase [Candidatus Pelagibacter ubique]
MLNNQNIFYKKKILIYGLGKSGLSAFKFLKKNNQITTHDDKIKSGIKRITSVKFDYIIISPGIDIHKCNLSKFLKKNSKKIYTDLDVFYSHHKQNNKITITGTNGKSTTAKILYEVLKDQKIDVRLVGNIGNPVLLEKKVTNKTVFVIEASSYQLEYSKLFKSNISLILNISPDHLERHRTITRYVAAKFKLIKNQSENDYAILNTKNFYIKRELKLKNFLPKLIKIENNIDERFLKRINNQYFSTDGNRENIKFIFEVTKILKLKKNILIKTLKKFKGLKYRQEKIFQSKKLTIINDSKSTSFSSSASLLKSLTNVHWIVGGQAKKGDKLLLSQKNCKDFKAYIFGANKSFFISKIKRLMKYESFADLKSLIKKLSVEIKTDKKIAHKTILFSPSAASFDYFKNFEKRGEYFNQLIKKYLNT